MGSPRYPDPMTTVLTLIDVSGVPLADLMTTNDDALDAAIRRVAQAAEDGGGGEDGNPLAQKSVSAFNSAL